MFWFSGKDAGAKLNAYRIIFNGSVSGLSRGAQVLYNGLQVGEVTSLELLPDDPSKVVARVEIDARTPMNVDTRARLEFQGLTGVASIQLSGGGPGSAPLDSKDATAADHLSPTARTSRICWRARSASPSAPTTC